MTNCPQWEVDNRSKADKIQLLAVYKRAIIEQRGSPFSNELILGWHGESFKRTTPDGYEYYAGNYRQPCPNRTCLNQFVRVGSMTGARPNDVQSEMNMLVSQCQFYIEKIKEKLPDMDETKKVQYIALAVASIMGSFNKTHPFLNGNGRITRLIMKWFLAQFDFVSNIKLVDRPKPEDEYNQAIAAASKGIPKKLSSFILKTITEC